jgi:membrane fusion protein (multidrug efflux system)
MHPGRRWRRPLLIMGPVTLVIGALGLYLATGRYVSEEDAYMQAVSASIGPQVVGQIVSIAAKSNTQLSKDAPLFNLDPEPYRFALANAQAQLGIARDQAHTLIETYRARLAIPLVMLVQRPRRPPGKEGQAGTLAEA